MRMKVQSLTLLSGLRIQHYHELLCRLQLGSCMAVAVVEAGSCSSDSTPTLGTSMCNGYSPKKTKKKKKYCWWKRPLCHPELFFPLQFSSLYLCTEVVTLPLRFLVYYAVFHIAPLKLCPYVFISRI